MEIALSITASIFVIKITPLLILLCLVDRGQCIYSPSLVKKVNICTANVHVESLCYLTRDLNDGKSVFMEKCSIVIQLQIFFLFLQLY